MLNVGLIGAGNMGSKHAKILSSLHEEKICNFVACCDLILDKAEKAVFTVKGKAYKDFKSMLKNETLDGIIIATPTSTHYEIALFAIKKGINVLIEKPVSVEFEESKKIYDFTKKNNIIVGAGMTEVFNSIVVNLKKMIKKRDLALNTAIFNRFGFRSAKNDLKDMDVIYDLMIHDLAVLFELFDYPSLQVIGARPLQLNSKSGFHDAATAFLINESSNIILSASRSSKMKVRKFHMDFDKLYLEGDYMDQKIDIFSSSKFEFSEASNNLWYNTAFNHSTARYANNPLYDEDLDFINAIKRNHQPKIGPEQWILIMEAIQEIESHLFQ